MIANRTIIEAIQDIAGTRDKSIPELVICTVLSVDTTNQTIDAKPLTSKSSVNFEGAYLGASEDEKNNGLLYIPKVGSLVGIIQQSSIYSRVVLFSEIESISFLGGAFGGLIKIEELVKKVNTIEQDLNDLKQAFTSWVVVPTDGGAALKAITSTWASATITETKRTDIENEKIKHG